MSEWFAPGLPVPPGFDPRPTRGQDYLVVIEGGPPWQCWDGVSFEHFFGELDCDPLTFACLDEAQDEADWLNQLGKASRIGTELHDGVAIVRHRLTL